MPHCHLKKRHLETPEGSGATNMAFRRLFTTVLAVFGAGVDLPDLSVLAAVVRPPTVDALKTARRDLIAAGAPTGPAPESSPPAGRATLEAEDLVALMIAGDIDAAILLLAFAMRRSGLARVGDTLARRPILPDAFWDGETLAAGSALRRSLGLYEVETAGDRYVVLARGDRSDRAAKMRILLDLLEAAGQVRRVIRPAWWLRGALARHGHPDPKARSYHVYRQRHNLSHELVVELIRRRQWHEALSGDRGRAGASDRPWWEDPAGADPIPALGARRAA